MNCKLGGQFYVSGEVDRVNVGVHVDEITNQIIFVICVVEMVLEIALHYRIVGLEL